ncbi:MAG TPA: hypothetical protein VG753_00370 [Candidatus Paceibacterota bacterium]|nr:hypothetical protein [Candidatus Paceibacterota bacterium]
MATVIDTPDTVTTREKTVVERNDVTGWVVAVIILLAVVAGVAWMYYHPAATPAAAPATSNGGANINVTLPSGSAGGTSDGSTPGNASNPDTSTPPPTQ